MLEKTIKIPKQVAEIVDGLENAGFEAWCVGGALRDSIIDSHSGDFDVATSARPEDVIALFRRTVPVGIEHGTVGVIDSQDVVHEVTTFRRDVKTDGRHATVEFGVSIDEDLARRDFTINSLAFRPRTNDWKDLFGGINDISAGIVRAVGNPELRFREDYLRILRAIRFACRFGFEVVEETWEAAIKCHEGLTQLSAERVRDEWFKSLVTAKSSARVVEMWDEVGAAKIWLPEIETGSDLSVLGRITGRDPVLLTCALAADPGGLLRRLKSSNAQIRRAELIGRNLETPPVANSLPDVRGWLSKVDPVADDLLNIWNARTDGAELRNSVAKIRQDGDPLAISDLALNGADLASLGVPEGPAIGKTLCFLRDAVHADPANNTRGILTDLVRQNIERKT